jgi:hypothetical protein
MKIYYCDICNAPMKFVKRLANHQSRHHAYQNRRRRFACTVCDFEKTIYADGEADEKFIPDQGIDAVKKMFKQEEINRQ